MKSALHKQSKSSRKPERLFAMRKTSKFLTVSLECLNAFFQFTCGPQNTYVFEIFNLEKMLIRGFFFGLKREGLSLPYWSSFLQNKLQLNKKCI